MRLCMRLAANAHCACIQSVRYVYAIHISYELFLTTTVPSNYFLLNADGNKFIPMNQGQTDDGIMITPNEILYKPSTITQHRSDKICVWKLFNEPSITNAINICEIGIIPPMNYLISINENNLYYIHIETTLKIWENCNDLGQKSIELRGKRNPENIWEVFNDNGRFLNSIQKHIFTQHYTSHSSNYHHPNHNKRTIR